MPIKDVSKEEQSNLFLSGSVFKEAVKLTEHDRGDYAIGWYQNFSQFIWTIPTPFNSVNFGGKLPLQYYNILNEEMTKRDEVRDYGNIPGANQDVSNPNAMNRPFAWPIKMRSSMAKYDQVSGGIAGGDFAPGDTRLIKWFANMFP